MPIDEEVQTEFDGIDRRLLSGKERMDAIEASIAENTRITKEIKEILDLGKSFFTILGYVAKVAKWIAAIGSGIAVVYAIAHGSIPPKE